MKELSITQEYLLCAFNEKGRFPIIGKEQPTCFVAGALLELLMNGYIQIQKENIVIIKDIDESVNYLSPMYKLIQDSKPKKIKDLVRNYVFSLTEKNLIVLIQSVGNSLVLMGCADEINKKNFLGRPQKLFNIKKDKTDHVIQKVRTELLEEGTINEETIALTSLLNKGGLLRQYFSKYESQQLKKRLEEIKNTHTSQVVKEMIDYVNVILAAIIAASSSNV